MMKNNSQKNKRANKCSKPITIKEIIMVGYILFNSSLKIRQA